LLLFACLLFAYAETAAGQVITSTWSGTSGNWTNPALWSTNPNYPNNGNPPGTTYNAVINGSGTITLDASITIEQLAFQGGQIFAPFGGGSKPLTMNANMSWSGGTLIGQDLTVNANGGAALTGSDDLLSGTLNLRGNSTVTGLVSMGGQLVNDIAGTLTTLAGSRMDIPTGGQPFLNRGAFRVAGDTVLTGMTSTGSVEVQSGVLTVRLSQGGGLGNITVSGPTTVAANATVSVAQQSSLNVTGPGVLRGAGTIGGPGPTTIGSGGTLAPGVGPGVLHMAGPLTMGSGSIFQAELGGPAPGSQYDQLDLSGGSVSLNRPSLQTLLAYAPAPTDALTILLGGPVSGTFAGLPDGTQFVLGTFGGVPYAATINYTPSSVVLSNIRPVPEPAAWLLAAAAAGVWARRRRR